MTTDPIKLGVIIGSTRTARFADKPAQWLMAKLAADDAFDAEILDVRDFDLPFFDEAASNMHLPSESPQALAWQAKIAAFDAYVFVTPEYNHSIPASLKNALDQAYREWNLKAFGALGYGGLGAARAVQDLRAIGVALQMTPVASAVHVGGAEFLGVHPMGRNAPFETLDGVLAPSLGAMLDQLEWWARATMAARAGGVGAPGKRGMAAAETLKAMMSAQGDAAA